MKLFLLTIFTVISFTILKAQNSPEPQPDMGVRLVSSSEINSIYGKLIDGNTGKPIEAASVQLYFADNKKSDSLLDGMLSKPNGDFRFQNIPVNQGYKLVISSLGYQTIEQLVFPTNDSTAAASFSKDVGNISLLTEAKKLGEVIITSSRPSLQMGIDRKIFDVSKSLLATGGTAVDVMKNIPSVSVDIEGNVELRNSTPQIFVDGRPTILTLDQIPADNIDKIELITNPSAKFDASSSGGIINVVLKKNKRIGLNGLASVSGGTPSLFSANLNLNLRQGKFNFFGSGGLNQSGGVARGETLRRNKSGGIITDYFNQYSENERERKFYNLRFGTDFFMDNRNTFSISQDFEMGNFGNEEVQQQEYLNNNQVLQYTGNRITNGNSEFNRSSTRFNYKHSFPKDGMELTADISYNLGSNANDAAIVNNFTNPDGSTNRDPSSVVNNGSSDENNFTFQADYANPISEKAKIETGIRSYHKRYESNYDAFSNQGSQLVKLPLSNNYAYNEMVNAAYFTYSYKKDNFSYQAGLRTELSNFDGELIDSAYKFGYNYPNKLSNIWDALFPSFFITQQLGDNDELQFNYSRRIRRPRFWQLNPFIEINDPVNLRQGNPELRPEFVNSFEFNYNYNYNKGNFLGVLYFRNNPDDITQYSDTITTATYQQLANAGIDPNAILNTFVNASTTNRYGAEFTLQHKPSEKFEITPTINLQYRTVNAKINDLDLSNEGFNWEAKLIANYKIENPKKPLLNNLGFQMILDYESPQVLPQGRNLSEFDVDMALRKDFLKNKKATITFAVNDLFNTRRWGAVYDTDKFYQDSYRRWNVRNFRLSFSYKFGDTNFTLFNNGNRGSDNSQDD